MTGFWINFEEGAEKERDVKDGIPGTGWLELPFTEMGRRGCEGWGGW